MSRMFLLTCSGCSNPALQRLQTFEGSPFLFYLFSKMISFESFLQCLLGSPSSCNPFLFTFLFEKIQDLLVATRHILSTPFKDSFGVFVEQLTDEEILLGQGVTCYYSVRPLAFSTLADLIHHIRAQLNLNQMEKVIRLYSKNLHDLSLPLSFQTMSVKLLLNLLDSIGRVEKDVKPSPRDLLFSIFDTFVNKFTSIRNIFQDLIYQSLKKADKEETKDTSLEEPYLGFEVFELEKGYIDLTTCQAIKTITSSETSSDPLKGVRLD